MTISSNHPATISRVMVVDDSAAIRRMLAVRLRHEGLVVVEARNGEDAVDRFRAEPAQVVVTDLRMPGLGGLDLLTELRRERLRPEVILLTGGDVDHEAAAQQARRLGALHYIPKTPAALEAVVLAVEHAFEAFRARENDAVLAGHTATE